jgi:hypothetical protein
LDVSNGNGTIYPPVSSFFNASAAAVAVAASCKPVVELAALAAATLSLYGA